MHSPDGGIYWIYLIVKLKLIIQIEIKVETFKKIKLVFYTELLLNILRLGKNKFFFNGD